MHDLNNAIEAAKSSGNMTLALPGSAVCIPPRSEFWLRPPALRKLSYKPVSSVMFCPLSPRALIQGSRRKGKLFRQKPMWFCSWPGHKGISPLLSGLHSPAWSCPL